MYSGENNVSARCYIIGRIKNKKREKLQYSLSIKGTSLYMCIILSKESSSSSSRSIMLPASKSSDSHCTGFEF